MDEAMIELGRRAVACTRWEWMPGMRYVTPQGAAGRWVMMPDWSGSGERMPFIYVEDTHHSSQHEDVVPDLTDPATIGCLEHLVRKAWDGGITIGRRDGCWEVYRASDLKIWTDSSTDSYAEALVCALEATL